MRYSLAAAFAAAITTSCASGSQSAGGDVVDVGAGGTRASTALEAPLPGTTYIALRAAGDVVASFGGGQGPSVNGPIIAEVGERCSGSCEDQLETALKGFAPSNTLFAARAGDLLTVIDGPGFLKQFGPIDSPEKAVLLLWLSGHAPEGMRDSGGKVALRAARTDEGFVVPVIGEMHCGSAPPGSNGEADTRWRDVLLVAKDGTVTTKRRDVLERGMLQPCMPLGRRPQGFVAHASPGSIQSWLCTAAMLESVSIPAFEHLAEELAARGAPRALVERTRRAARDEKRHADAFIELGGRSMPPPVFLRSQTRSVEDIAIDNAREGCVLETFSALLALLQSKHAESRMLRAAMAPIAEDERRHAELARDIDDWCSRRLQPADRRRVLTARRSAVNELEAQLRRGDAMNEALRALLGLPSPDKSLAMFGVVREWLEA
ncbi:MAG: ferritin-like domain-containing protein [Polyangiaceae bacterium]|nr:ferritin-like domain-containing protein [Polyangiaceae bacterium]